MILKVSLATLNLDNLLDLKCLLALQRTAGVTMEMGETPRELLELQDKILMGGVEAVSGSSTVTPHMDLARPVEKKAGKRPREPEVKARPSGNNSLTFFMPDDDEEPEEDEYAVAVGEEDGMMDVEAVNPVGRSHEEDEEEIMGDIPRERQLTQKFLAGQLSFKDLMQVPVLRFRNAGSMS